MSKWNKLGWLTAGAAGLLILEVLLVLILRLDVADRPPAPPEDKSIPYPWGAIDLDEIQTDPEAGLQVSMTESFR